MVGAVTEPHAGRPLLGALGLAAQPPPHRFVTVSCPARDPGNHPRRPPSLPADPWEPALTDVSPSPSRPALALAGPACRR
jgi:hypothetical protein